MIHKFKLYNIYKCQQHLWSHFFSQTKRNSTKEREFTKHYDKDWIFLRRRPDGWLWNSLKKPKYNSKAQNKETEAQWKRGHAAQQDTVAENKCSLLKLMEILVHRVPRISKRCFFLNPVRDCFPWELVQIMENLSL